MRHNFSPTIKKQLCANVGGKCSNPNCRKPTTWPDYTGTKSDSIGEAAHIYAASIEDGPRLNPTMSADEIKHISNGIWLCSNCHTMVDRNVQRFPAELLKNGNKMWNTHNIAKLVVSVNHHLFLKTTQKRTSSSTANKH